MSEYRSTTVLLIKEDCHCFWPSSFLMFGVLNNQPLDDLVVDFADVVSHVLKHFI